MPSLVDAEIVANDLVFDAWGNSFVVLGGLLDANKAIMTVSLWRPRLPTICVGS